MPFAKPKSAPQPSKLQKAAVKPKAVTVAKTGPKLEKSGKTAISAKTSRQSVPVTKALAKSAKSDIPLKKVPAVPSKSTQAQLLAAADALLVAPAKKKPGRHPKTLLPRTARPQQRAPSAAASPRLPSSLKAMKTCRTSRRNSPKSPPSPRRPLKKSNRYA